MNDTQAQALFEKYSEEMKRHIGILIEDSNDKFKLLAEMFGGMNETLTLVAEDVDELKTRMSTVEDRMGGLEQKVERVASDVTDIKKQMGSKVDTITHLALEHRVSALEQSA